jgi:hypothetical protein
MLKYRVWTKNIGDTVSIMTEWRSRSECKRFIIGRWGHWPPFAFISRCENAESFRRYHPD